MPIQTYLIAAEAEHGPSGTRPIYHGDASYDDLRINASRWIPLADGRSFFLVTTDSVSKSQIIELLGDTGEIISTSYQELYESDNPIKEEVFRLTCTRRRLDDTRDTSEVPASSVVPGETFSDEPLSTPTGLAGIGSAKFPLWQSYADRLKIHNPIIEESSKPNTIIYPCLGLGVLDTINGVADFGDCIWRPAALYGPRHPILGSSAMYMQSAPVFSGAFEFSTPQNFPDMQGAALGIFLEENAQRLYRIFAAVGLMSAAKPDAVVRVWRNEDDSSGTGSVQQVGYAHWMGSLYNQRPNIPLMLLKKAVLLASSGKQKGLSAAIKYALNAVAQARFSVDLRISYILIWAAIESLATADNREGLTTNISLALLGARGPAADSYSEFKALKDAYSVRSALVHNFRVPVDEDFQRRLRFCFRYLRELFHEAVAEIDNGREDTTKFISRLTERALALS
jgi:hypothetical protein